MYTSSGAALEGTSKVSQRKRGLRCATCSRRAEFVQTNDTKMWYASCGKCSENCFYTIDIPKDLYGVHRWLDHLRHKDWFSYESREALVDLLDEHYGVLHVA